MKYLFIKELSICLYVMVANFGVIKRLTRDMRLDVILFGVEGVGDN